MCVWMCAENEPSPNQFAFEMIVFGFDLYFIRV